MFICIIALYGRQIAESVNLNGARVFPSSAAFVFEQLDLSIISEIGDTA